MTTSLLLSVYKLAANYELSTHLKTVISELASSLIFFVSLTCIQQLIACITCILFKYASQKGIPIFSTGYGHHRTRNAARFS